MPAQQNGSETSKNVFAWFESDRNPSIFWLILSQRFLVYEQLYRSISRIGV